MEKKPRVREVIKTINIRTCKHKSFFFHLYVVRTQYYPGYRFKVTDEGDKEYKEILLKLSFFQKYEHLSIRFGIMDDRALPF